VKARRKKIRRAGTGWPGKGEKRKKKGNQTCVGKGGEKGGKKKTSVEFKSQAL